MDELGRGTSSFDGTAIASACLSYICSNLKCLSLFATHYHSLLDEWKNDSKVRLGHMESVVNDDDNDTEDQENITFLYTLGNGACPKSFGVNVARLARLPEEVLKTAQRISGEFEILMNMNSKISPNRAVEQQRQVAELIREGKVEDVEALWEELQQQ
jgi:DNA mismatch repair protein MSH6